jgi:hypothetical protein
MTCKTTLATDEHTLLLPRRGYRLMATDKKGNKEKIFDFHPCGSVSIRGKSGRFEGEL